MPVAEMIDTLTESTKAYLALLERSNAGTLRHPVSRIQILPDTCKSIENAAWPVITCTLPTRLKFQPDSAATLVPTSHPGRAIPIQILSYNSASGAARLAAQSAPPDTTGHLIIDFKWLLERLIQWLEKHGTSIANPFQLAGHLPEICETAGTQTMSDEQLASAASLLANPVAYVWGPPGTGKTRHVLAESVAHLVQHEKSVLVTAPTNLAVDNALDAILRTEGTRSLDMLRIGLPSDNFRNQWPECCEDKALNESLSQLNQKLAWLTERLNASRLKASLAERSSSLSATIATSRSEVELSEHELSGLDAEHAHVSAELNQLDLLIDSSQQHLNSIDSLPIDEQQISKAHDECERLRASMAAITQNLSDKRVLGMTLDGFVAFPATRPLQPASKSFIASRFTRDRASDTGRLQGNSPWLSDTSNTRAPGALVVNTAISRAKRHLRIFWDQDFWAQRRSPDSLLTALSNS